MGGEFIGWTNRKVVHPCRSNRLVDNPQVDETTLHLITSWFYPNIPLRDSSTSFFLLRTNLF